MSLSKPAKRSRVETKQAVAPPAPTETRLSLGQLLFSTNVGLAVIHLAPFLDPLEMFSARRVSTRFREILSTPSVADAHWKRLRVPRRLPFNTALCCLSGCLTTLITQMPPQGPVTKVLTATFPATLNLEGKSQADGQPLAEPPRQLPFWSSTLSSTLPVDRDPYDVSAVARKLMKRGEKSAAYIVLSYPWRCDGCDKVLLELGTGHSASDHRGAVMGFSGGHLCAICESKSLVATLHEYHRYHGIRSDGGAILLIDIRDELARRGRRCINDYYQLYDLENAVAAVREAHAKDVRRRVWR